MGLWDGLYRMGIGLGNDGKRVRFVISSGFQIESCRAMRFISLRVQRCTIIYRMPYLGSK